MAMVCQILFCALLVLSVLLLLLGVVARYGAVRLRKEETREWEKKQKDASPRAVFVAYRAQDEALARSVSHALEPHNIRVLMWEPAQPFDDPVRTVFEFIDSAAAIVVVNSEEASDWIRGEGDLAKRLGKEIVSIDAGSDVGQLIARLERVFETSRPFSAPPWMHYDLAQQVLEGAVDQESWSAMRIEADPVGEATVSDMCFGFILYALAMWLGGAAFFFRWLATRLQ